MPSRSGSPLAAMVLVVNKVPTTFDLASVKTQVAQQYGCDVAAVLPHFDEMMTLASSGIFALRYPNHPITASLRQVAKMLVE